MDSELGALALMGALSGTFVQGWAGLMTATLRIPVIKFVT
jgi:hypothetical protein